MAMLVSSWTFIADVTTTERVEVRQKVLVRGGVLVTVMGPHCRLTTETRLTLCQGASASMSAVAGNPHL